MSVNDRVKTLALTCWLAAGSVRPWRPGELCQQGRSNTSLPRCQQPDGDRRWSRGDVAERLRPARRLRRTRQHRTSPGLCRYFPTCHRRTLRMLDPYFTDNIRTVVYAYVIFAVSWHHATKTNYCVSYLQLKFTKVTTECVSDSQKQSKKRLVRD